MQRFGRYEGFRGEGAAGMTYLTYFALGFSMVITTFVSGALLRTPADFPGRNERVAMGWLLAAAVTGLALTVVLSHA